MATGEMTRVGTGGFIARHGIWDDRQLEMAQAVIDEVEARGLKRVRIGWGDQHGIIRGKTVSIPEFRRSLADGKDFQLVTTMFDTTNHPIMPPFAAGNFDGVPEMTGLPDGVLVPDPATFKVLPWVSDTGWILADAYFTSGRPVPFSTRQVYREQLAKLKSLGYEFTAGLEIEFYVFRLEDPMLATQDCGWPPTPPKVSGLSHGYQYLTENRGDEIHELLAEIEDNVTALGLPLATVEDEWAPGSGVAGPDGGWVAERVCGSEAIIYADLELGRVHEERLMFDPTGHYARPDVFETIVHRGRQRAVRFDEATPRTAGAGAA